MPYYILRVQVQYDPYLPERRDLVSFVYTSAKSIQLAKDHLTNVFGKRLVFTIDCAGDQLEIEHVINLCLKEHDERTGDYGV